MSNRHPKTGSPLAVWNSRGISAGRRRAVFAVALVLALLIGLSVVLEHMENQRHVESLRSDMYQRLGVIRARIEGDLNGELLLSRSLVTEVRGRSEMSRERFMDVAADFLSLSKNTRNIALAKGTVITFIYPVEENKAALGVDYRRIPGQWPAVEKAIESRHPVIAGPVDLIQGGRAIIGRTPIYVPDEKQPGKDRFYGLVSTVIDIDRLLSQSGIGAVSRHMRCALRGEDPLGKGGDLIYGDASVMHQAPLLMDIQLPSAKWQLAAVPAGGWPQNSPRILWLRLSTLVLGLLVISTGILFRAAHERRQAAGVRYLEQERRIHLTVEAASIYWWEVDKTRDLFVTDPLWFTKELHYSSSGDIPHTVTELEALVHPEDYEVLMGAMQDHLLKGTSFFRCDIRMKSADGSFIWQFCKGKIMEVDPAGRPLRAMGVSMDISERKRMEEERDKLITELQGALANVKALSGLLPICARCKKIRDDKGYWSQIETYISRHSEVEFSHGLCPHCAQTLYPDIKLD